MTRAGQYEVINGWLAQRVDGCTCAPGPMGEHEPGCGWEPLDRVEDIAARMAGDCSCGQSPETYDGPHADCDVHGLPSAAYSLGYREGQREATLAYSKAEVPEADDSKKMGI